MPLGIRPLAAAFVAATSPTGALIAHPVTTSLASVARAFPADVRLPPYTGTATYRFVSNARLRELIESGGRLFVTVASSDAPGASAALLELDGRDFRIVPLPGGPYRTLAVTQREPGVTLLEASAGGASSRASRFVIAEGRLARTRRRGDGSRPIPAAGVRCLDARATSAYDGAALVVFDAATGLSRPSISKAVLSAATDDASSDLSLSVRCHSFGPDLIVWLAAAAAPGVRPSGVSLFDGARMRPLLDVAPSAVSEHYLLFARGGGAASPTEYTLVRDASSP